MAIEPLNLDNMSRLTERNCADCNCIIDIIVDEYYHKKRKFLWFDLPTKFLCEVCYRNSKIESVLES
jgi:hypothetical protein